MREYRKSPSTDPSKGNDSENGTLSERRRHVGMESYLPLHLQFVMTITLTYHIPLKAKFDRRDLSCSIYIPFKKWLWGKGGWGKSRWIRLFGLTLWASWYRLSPIEFRFVIQ